MMQSSNQILSSSNGLVMSRNPKIKLYNKSKFHVDVKIWPIKYIGFSGWPSWIYANYPYFRKLDSGAFLLCCSGHLSKMHCEEKNSVAICGRLGLQISLIDWTN